MSVFVLFLFVRNGNWVPFMQGRPQRTSIGRFGTKERPYLERLWMKVHFRVFLIKIKWLWYLLKWIFALTEFFN